MIIELTWIISCESDDSPSSYWHANSVAKLWVDKIELPSIGGRVIVAKPLSQYVKVKAMEVHGMILHSNESCVLED